MHQCSVCPKSFPSPSKLQRHYVIHTGLKPFTCETCGKAFTQSEHLKTHTQKVHSSGPPDGISTRSSQLPRCDEPAAGIHTREQKNEVVTNEMCLPSPETGNQPESKQSVNYVSETLNRISNVMYTVTQKRVDSANIFSSVCKAPEGYTCNICFKSFASSLRLSIHSGIHNEPRRSSRGAESGRTFLENVDSKTRLQSRDLSSRTNKLTLKHQCSKCLKSFCSPSKLGRHFLLHTGQKPYSCKICWKDFRQKVHLKNHLRTAGKCSLSAVTVSKKPSFCHGEQTSGSQPLPSHRQQPDGFHALDSSVELELQCQISLDAVQHMIKTEIKSEAVVKQEQQLDTSGRCASLKSEEQEQQKLTEDLKPFQCLACNTSFLLEIDLTRHQGIHRDQNELNNVQQNSNDVKMLVPEAVEHLPKPGHIDPMDSNTVVKPVTWRDNCIDRTVSLPQNSPSTKSTEQWRKTVQSTGNRRQMNPLHQCHACSKCFPSVSKLLRHVMTHTGQKPFGCETCGKRFRQKSHLRVHGRTHLRSRYHKQRAMYINRPPSRRADLNTSTAANVPVQGMLTCKKDFETHGARDVVSVCQNDNRNSDSKQTQHASEKKEFVNVRNAPKVTLRRKQCFWCLKSFPSPSKLQRHEMVHRGLKPFQCLRCGKAFRQATHLKKHHRTHCDANLTKLVSQQGKITKQRVNGQQQQHQPYSEVKVRITRLSKSFMTNIKQNEPRSSSSVQQNSNPVKMPVAEAKVHLPKPGRADPMDLNVVVKPVTRSENCIDRNDLLPQNSLSIISKEQCRETNHSTSKLQRINTLHQCHACSKRFPSVSKLLRHVMTHTGQKPFGCETCGKRFRQKSHLRVHGRTHLRSRYHKQRAMYINRPPSLKTSSAANVPVQGMVTCKKDFETHSASDVVSVCQNDNSKSDSKQTQHASEKNGAVHLRSAPKVTLRRKQCFWCLKSFQTPSKLQRHEMVHRGLKPFQCLRCGKAFRQAPHLKKHQQTHCEANLAKPVSQHDNITKQRVNGQQQSYPKISVSIPTQAKSLRTDMKLSNVDRVVSNERLCTRRESSIPRVNSLFRANPKSKVTTSQKSKLHTCQICSKNFCSPYKLLRHMVTHSGIRTFKCTRCSKTYTQRGHLKAHEQKCGKSNNISHDIQGEIMNANHLQKTHTENLSDCTGLNGYATGESHYPSADLNAFTDGDLSYFPEATQTEWLAVHENDSNTKQTEHWNDDCSNLVPSEGAFTIAAPPLSFKYEDNTRNVEVLCKSEEVTAFPVINMLLSDGPVSSVIENQMHPENYWCEPLTLFECETCARSFTSGSHLKQHTCSNNVQAKTRESAQKNQCDICFKLFVSPSKLKRHYLTHTGQKPFSCDICGKTFTQSSHVRKHRLTH